MPVIPFIPLIAAVAGPLLSSALSKGNDSSSAAAAVPAPVAAAPAAIPASEDATAAAAKRASLAEQVTRRGRASTILTDNNDATESLG